ncbi:Zn-ribbon domain-containing OB-fold protein [Rhodopseudomonas sp. P2A-2r]|uniref:Zn-ribbon domain-containing OB-fold protein n=1 Tax=Rhodopseudomonas sp. P2A-2r TaxID=2991972 RepID=UPI0039B6F256
MMLPVLAVDGVRAFPPRVTEFTLRFWQGLASGHFETTRCDDCTRLTFPPKPFCPHCWSERDRLGAALRSRNTLFADRGARGTGCVSR